MIVAAGPERRAGTQTHASFGPETVGARTGRVRILIVTHDLLGDPFWAIFLHGVSEGAKDAGCETEHYRPEVFAPSDMLAVVQRALARHPDGLITTLPDPESLDPVLRAAIEDGLPVIVLNTLDRRPVQARLPALCSIGADDLRAGDGRPKRSSNPDRVGQPCASIITRNATRAMSSVPQASRDR